MANIKRTEDEIEEVLGQVSEARNEGSKYPGMTYEDGIDAMYEWLVGNTDENPMD